MICNTWDIVIVPFPFVDSSKSKPRPTLVLSQAAFNEENGHTIVAMITTGGETSWPSDTPVSELEMTGLKAASVIRMKIFTLDNRILRKVIGTLHTNDRQNIQKIWKKRML